MPASVLAPVSDCRSSANYLVTPKQPQRLAMPISISTRFGARLANSEMFGIETVAQSVSLLRLTAFRASVTHRFRHRAAV
jgi:hypothetical protein